MNIIKFLRKPYLAMFLASLIFTVSCTQNGELLITEKQSFDYSTFENFKNHSIDINFPTYIDKIKSHEEKSIAVINHINNEFNTTLELSNELIELGELNNSNMKLQGLTEGNFTNFDLEIINNFESDLTISNFEMALSNFETKIINASLSDIEFSKYNEFANMIKLVNNFDDSIFNQYEQKGCMTSIIAHGLATVALSSCGTGVLCPLAIAAWALSYYNMIEACQR